MPEPATAVCRGKNQHFLTRERFSGRASGDTPVSSGFFMHLSLDGI